jgi:serine/threonine protein phosphatase PrpC
MNIDQPVTDTNSSPSDTLLFTVGQYSIAGCKGQNEDAIGIRIPDGNLLTTKGAVAVIADGVSAAEAGQEASQTCVSNFLSDYFSTPESWSVKLSAQQVLTALNRWLFSRGRGFDDSRRGYISTMSTIVFKSHTAHIFHVGDSRVYRLREGVLEQLTVDHSNPVAHDHVFLVRAMGLDVRLDIDYQALPLQQDDVYLQTTDGIHDVLSHDTLRRLLEDRTTSESDICQKIVEHAIHAGSEDNLSCQIVCIKALPEARIDDVIRQLTRLQFPPFLESGMILDGYLILRELHASNRSQVYLVEDTIDGKRYCMKTPSVNFEDDPAYIERFVMESWIGSRISSPHVVTVVKSLRAKSCLYYITEYINGVTLTQWMRENPQPAVGEVVFLIDQIARGLRAMHRRETLHQDIKPDNILINHHGQLKIVDFGACHVAGIAEIASPLRRDIALGTASYSAPEYTLGVKANYRADLFSLAVISYEMLTGKLPFGGKLQHCKTQQDFLSTTYTESYKLNPLVPLWIDGALKKGLRFHEERRHGDVAEFVYELQHPNPRYLECHQRPLMERDPIKFWKMFCGVLVVAQIVSLTLLLG